MAKPICPKCKSEDIKKGVMGDSFGQVQMFPENIRGKSSPISAEYCNECGYMIALYERLAEGPAFQCRDECQKHRFK